MKKIIDSLNDLKLKFNEYYKKRYLLINNLAILAITSILFFITEVPVNYWLAGIAIIAVINILVKLLKIKMIVTLMIFNIVFIGLFVIMANYSNVLNITQQEEDNYRRNVVSFNIQTPYEWQRLDSDKTIYHKFDNGKWKTVNMYINNRYIPDSLYGPYVDYAKNYISEFAEWKSTELVMINNRIAIRVYQENADLGVTYCIYLVNVPGERDIVVVILGATEEIMEISTDWEYYLRFLELEY